MVPLILLLFVLFLVRFNFIRTVIIFICTHQHLRENTQKGQFKKHGTTQKCRKTNLLKSILIPEKCQPFCRMSSYQLFSEIQPLWASLPAVIKKRWKCFYCNTREGSNNNLMYSTVPEKMRSCDFAFESDTGYSLKTFVKIIPSFTRFVYLPWH